MSSYTKRQTFDENVQTTKSASINKNRSIRRQRNASNVFLDETSLLAVFIIAESNEKLYDTLKEQKITFKYMKAS